MNLQSSRFLIAFLLVVVVSACSNSEHHEKNTQTSIKQVGDHQKYDQKIAELTKNELLRWESVQKVNAVEFDQTMIVAIDVRQRDKFQSQILSKKAQKKLTEQFPSMKITVSADKKIFIELGKIQKQLKKGKLDQKQLEKRLKKIKKIENDRY